MEQPQYLIDTNVVIDYLGQKIPLSGMKFMNNIIDNIPNVSVITKIEVLGFNAPAEHYQLLTDFMNDATVIELTNKVVDASIEIRKNYKTKLPDAVIAATALVYDLTIISRNVSDFKNIQNLKVINPHSL
ncbi:type II toxin-antitoxin system VapC family toxin [Flavobacterium sp. ZT3R18]|uniref:type II toxin-antitoxin system VapC family toxin n=1 Tax=Flavobacterium sp. ZT3R18 TaxID=2594429 RepID=UPI00117AA951|nr:type II toxin-antitoxin system VapC family toxin [Flavobacterium sp. ZT3R18]TRX35108.1 type II toxin-antitoxin system VapC family toxin [Flavobacterium sp. ZT3R18]